MSRSLAQRWIKAGLVSVDGHVALRASDRVPDGATVEVAVPASAVRRARPQAHPGDLEILYEDDVLIALNKPAGSVVHPSYKHAGGTLLNAVLWHLRERDGASPGILTRLDKDTSGLVLIALTAAVQAAVQRHAAAGRVRKEYLAVVRGTPRSGVHRIVLPLARDPLDRRRVVVALHGAPSETRCEVLSASHGMSLVRCELITGRTHQIRVHLAARGWPIAGDALYGEVHDGIARQALHAWRLALPHPTTGRLLQIEAPFPPDMRRLAESQNLTL